MPVKPLRMPALQNTAEVAAMRMSHPSVRHMPPPYAGPLTAAMSGWAMARMAGTTSDMYCMALMPPR